jgi:hypothetical protein
MAVVTSPRWHAAGAGPNGQEGEGAASGPDIPIGSEDSRVRSRVMNELTRIYEALDLIAADLERLRILKEYELGVELKEAPEGSGPYVPKVEK